MSSIFNQRLITSILVLSIALISFMTYSEMLGYFFTATDSPTLIDTGRIRSFRDVTRIFSEPLMNGTTLTDSCLFYRPICTLSYSLDYFVWGLNPFGYHLTDLILHILVSILVFFLLKHLTLGRHFGAWAGAVVFATHPILVESVPAVSRRHETIAALFLLAALLLFIKHLSSRSHRQVLLLFSTLSYILAIMAKETAVILPVLLFAYFLVFSPTSNSITAKILSALRPSLPFLIAAVVVVSYRSYVLDGMGGYVAHLRPASSVISFAYDTFVDYFTDLVYPVPFIRFFFHPFPTVLQQAASLIALFCFIILLCLYRRALFKVLGYGRRPVLRTLLIGLTSVTALSVIGILAYFSLSPYVNQLLERSYYDKGPRVLSAAMTNRSLVPVESYFYAAGGLLSELFSHVLFVSGFCIIGLLAIEKRDHIKHFLTESRSGKVVSFFLIWLCLPLAVYLCTFTFSHRYMYISVIPFAGILSVLLSDSIRSAAAMIRRRNSTTLFLSAASEPPALASLLMFALAVSLVANSPLVRTYGEWKDSAEISSTILHHLSQSFDQFPNDSTLHIFNLPDGISSYQTQIPSIRTTGYLKDYSIKSWLDLTRPINNVRVVVHSRSTPEFNPRHLYLETTRGEGNDVVLLVKFDDRAALPQDPPQVR